jgi:hypothetical protein
MRARARPPQAVAAALRARGRDAASLAAMRQSETRNGRAGMKHLRFEQTVDGMPVYGAYAKAAFDRQGNLVQVIDRLSRVPAGALKAPKVEPLQALRTAMGKVHPGVVANFKLKTANGGVSVFDGGAFFDEAPTVTLGGGADERRHDDPRLPGRDLVPGRKPVAPHPDRR